MSTEPYRWHYDYSRIAWDTGFYFNNQKTQKAFDRNSIALLDIERIIHERDIGIVEHHIQNILGYNLDNEEARILDPNFVKLFRLSQLAVEYLIYCKKYLDTTVNTIKKDLQKVNEENDDLKHDLVYYQTEVQKLKKKVKDLKSTLQVVQKYQPIGFSNEPLGTFQCNECNKLFVNSEYLKSHILRRHPNNDQELIDIGKTKGNETQINTTPVHTQYKAETDRLQMEIKELKEKLNNTERYFKNTDENKPDKQTTTDPSKSEEYCKHVEKLHEQFELLKGQIESEMQILKEQKNEQVKYDKMMETIIHKLDEKGDHDMVDKKCDVQTNTPEPNIQDKEVQVDIKEEKIQTADLPQKEKNAEIKETSEINKVNYEKNIKKNIPSPKKQLNGPKSIESPSRFIKVAESLKISKSSVEVPKTPDKIQSSPQVVLPDISKVKEEVGKELEEKTKQNIEKLSEEITEKMSNTFSILQERLELFWNKIQEIEVAKEKQLVATNLEIQQIKNESSSILKPSTTTVHTQKMSIPDKLSDTDLDSDTESSKQEIIQRSSSSIITFNKNQNVSKNLIAELKNKLHEKNVAKKNEIIQKSVETPKKIASKQSESSSESETESEESDSDVASYTPLAENKSSKTVTQFTEGEQTTVTGKSTLRDRSIKSLENALHNNPEILEIFKKDLNEVVSHRLQDLGIDPEWTRIPDKTFKQKSDIISHERNLAVKKIKPFLDIRQNIILNLEEKIKKITTKESPKNSPELENRPSRFKSLFVNMRNKAKSIIKSDKPTPQNTPNRAIYKLTVQNHPSMLPTTKKTESEFNTKKNLNKSNKQTSDTLKITKPIMYETDSDNTDSIQQSVIKPKPATRSNKNIRKSRSDSSMEILNLSDQNDKPIINPPVPAARSMDSILEMKKELKSQLHKSVEKIYSSTELETDYKNKIIKTNLQTHEAFQTKNISSSDDESSEIIDEKVQKSVLKLSSTITGGTKKKVLFDLHSDDKQNSETNKNEAKSVDIQNSTVRKTIVKSNSIFKNNEWNDTSSLDSSIFEMNKSNSKESIQTTDQISTKAVINVSTKQNDDISDFDISDLN